uniref:Fucosyltransferase n=2 Tax=Schistosoma japonicum TaxID=6182 RepID=C1LEJ0_SCHJA|nr:Glycoprotein 3-alpha-L-fucosyltransferase A [Schistosoma japonicum]
MNVLHHRYYFWKHHNEVNQRLSTYSTFNELKRDYIEGKIQLNTEEIKEIVIYGKPTVPINSQLQGCPVSNCILHTIKWRSDNAQMVIITNRKFPDVRFHKNQVWLAYDYEAPPNSRLNKRLGDKINFTATYRHDSTIHLPYGKLIKIPEFNSKLNNSNSLKPRNISATKKKTVAWIVSNCSPSSPRNLYAYELSKYITVDVYGKCNQRKCQYSKCHKMLRKHYKFYLSFENCLCQDYITEKFFENALMNNVIPVVMGASIEEYQSVAPPNSFIHVDQFASPKKLAEYLHYLDKNHTAFNEYFTWQDKWRVVLFPGRPECDFCLLANVIPFLKPSWYSDMRLWLTNSCEGRKLKWKEDQDFSPNDWFFV